MSPAARVRVAVDATPLLGVRTGIGTYTARLLESLVQRHDDLDLVATAFTARGGARLPQVLPAGVRARTRPAPARLLRAAWASSPWPPVELLCGSADVFHGTNFVLPPTHAARGVVTVHDLSFLTHPDTVHRDSLAYRVLVPRGLQRAAVVCTDSAAVADEVVREYGTDRDRIVVAPPGVDPGWYDAVPLTADERTRAGLPATGPYVVAVGTLEPRKNLPRLLRAHAAVWAGGSRVPLVLVGARGWGPALALEQAAAGSVVLPGYLDDEVLRGVVAGAAALAFPSLYEGFGIPPVEALACGVPVVAADLPVTREVLGDAAVLVDPTDVAALAAGLRRVLEQPGGATEREMRRAQARTWTWERCADAVHGAYVRAAAAPHA